MLQKQCVCVLQPVGFELCRLQLLEFPIFQATTVPLAPEFFPISAHICTYYLSTEQHCRIIDMMACQITRASHVAARIFFSTGLAFLAGPPANQSFLPAIEILGCVSSDHIAEAGKNCMLLAFLPGEHALTFSPIFLVETIGQSLPREQQSSLTFQQCQQVDW